MMRKLIALSAVLATVVAISSDVEAAKCCKHKRNRCCKQRQCCNYAAPCGVCNTPAAAPAAEAAPAAAAPAAK